VVPELTSPSASPSPSPGVANLNDPVVLRAFAHPTRIKLVGLLRIKGPLTATRAAALTHESVASCSFHLRQLAKYGLVELAEGGRGREKPWRATTVRTVSSAPSGDPATDAAALAVRLAAAHLYLELTTHWLRTEADEPAAWSEAAAFGDTTAYLTPPELRTVLDTLDEAMRPFLSRAENPAERPRDARPVMVMRTAFPVLAADEPQHEGEED
jgi:DNA-binding transcriptional ArsR family regulator